jgi:hypothetical protein
MISKKKLLISTESSKSSDSESSVSKKLFPIVIDKDEEVANHSPADDFDELSDSDESSAKWSGRSSIKKYNRKLGAYNNVNNVDDSKIKESTTEPSSKKSKGNPVSYNSTALDVPIPRKVTLLESSKTNNPYLKPKQIDNLKVVLNKEVASDQNTSSASNLKDNEVAHLVTPSTSTFITENDNCIVDNSTDSTDIQTAPVETDVNDVINDTEDLGINAEDIPPAITVGTPMIQKLPEALLRCAYIQNDNSQTVVFWCEELTRWAFRCQNKIVLDMREGKRWVSQEIPFASQANDPHIVLNLHRNNIFVKGVHGTYGLRLFHYTLRSRFQTQTNMKNTARRIAAYVNEDCKATLIYDESRLFLYTKPCVWSNLIGKKLTIDKLIRDTNEVLNGKMSSNPKFWDKHNELIKKFFFYNKLQPDIAELLNAPLSNIDPSIPRTPELLRSVESRRSAISLNNAPDRDTYEMLDPEEEVFITIIGSSNSSVVVRPDVNISLDEGNSIVSQDSGHVDTADIHVADSINNI